MGKYLHLYHTQEQFETAYDGSDYLEPWVSFTEDVERVDYNKQQTPPPLPDPTGEYFTIEALSTGNILWKGYATLEYSKNEGTWTQITATSTGTPISVVAGDTVRFRGNNPNGIGGNSFSRSDISFKISGNIMSLLAGDGFETATTLTGGGHFNGFFEDCSALTDASRLAIPATTVAPSCYMSMFKNCYNMVKGPAVLPALTLASNCYTAMFQDCTSLTAATVICATTLASYCCSNMFERCSSMTVAQEVLPATTLAASCYFDMFDHCESLETAPVVPATTLAGQCCSGMFQHCFSMKHVQPVLPATTLAEGCYANMFADNHILEVAPILPATTLVPSCYHSMFCDCWSLRYVKAMFLTTPSATYCEGWLFSIEERAPGTFVMNSEATWLNSVERGGTSIPPGWTVEYTS